ncbi:MAG: 3-hydroxyacyl-CoA dehydrogenase NAD-binding domain-containing protein [Gemmatimonadota bacterium]
MLTLNVETDGIGWLVLDTPGKLNVLSTEVMLRLNDLTGEIEDGALTGRIKAVVIRSGKEASFIAGANIDEIAAITDPSEGARKAAMGQSVFTRISRLPIPTVAAVDGICLGGGTELILACTYRLASDRKETRIGLPEVQLGILPGFGGTTRLPRLIGLTNALPIMLTGKPVDAKKAQRIGLIDERVPAPILYAQAGKLARALAGGLRPKRARRALAARALDDTAPGRALVLSKARKQVMKETRGNYPAPLRMLDILATILTSSIDAALELEARTVGELVVTPESKNLIHVFRLSEAARKAAPAAPAREVSKIGVLGAGVMGGGIAQLLAYRGFAVRLKDIKPEAIALGLRHAQQAFDKSVERRRLERRAARSMMQRISPTLGYTGFGSADLVIEAVVERMDVKKSVLRETEQHMKGGVLTSNTSSLSISELQSALQQPERFAGMHFFNPVERMPLVEIIRGAQTSDETVATVFAVARKLEKTPVIVGDGAGFLVNRILAPYLNDTGWLLSEGVAIQDVDRALLDFGMPMGPFRLLDEVGFDVARHAAGVMFEAFGERMRPAPAMAALERTERLGRKNELGFYTYENGREKQVDESVYADLGSAARGKQLPPATIQERCVYAMVNEAARILADGIVASPGDVDVGMIFGTGFPPFRGGLLKYADAVGLARIVDALDGYARELGSRFEAAPLLREKARAHGAFYTP